MSIENIELSVRGGPLFVLLSEQNNAQEIIKRFWHLVGPVGQIFRFETGTSETISLDTFLHELDPEKESYVDFETKEGYSLEMIIGPRLGDYYSLMLRIQRSFFHDDPESIPSMTADEYLQRTLYFEKYWTHLCEQVGADYAIFGYEALNANEIWRNDFAAAGLEPPNVPFLVKEADESFWLTYIGHHLSSEVTEETLASFHQAKWKRLPSGAIFIRGNFSPLINNDEAYYELDL